MKKNTVGTIAVATALVAVLAMPVLAEAGRGNGRAGNGKQPGVTKTVKPTGKTTTATAAPGKTKTPKTPKVAKVTKAAKASKAAKGQPVAQLKKRIARILAARKRRFDAVSANLNKRINRIASLATTVAAAGGDVSGVNAKLDAARQHLQNAIDLEQAAILMFEAIPSASNRHAAFVEARSAGRKAVAELKLARVSIRDAAVTLRAVVDGLKVVSTTGTADAQ